MIRMFQTQSVKHAKEYFRDALVKSDYYVSDQELPGIWQGKLAERLGLDGFEMETAFIALCENRHPGTEQSLTPRTKENRRVGYDINFHCPKSVSVLHAFSQDDHIVDAFRDSVTEVMKVIEGDTKTRVRTEGQNSDRKTEELAWAQFVHQTARPVMGQVPDPHLHSHCFVFNATYDAAEDRIKAGEFADIKRDMPFYQAMFHKKLADKLTDLGYAIRKTDKSFEIDGVPRKVIELFSKRTDEIGRIAKEKGITDAKDLDQLGARTRASKQKGRNMDELRQEWKRQIGELGEDGKSSAAVRFAPTSKNLELTAQQCLDHAILHHFERASVVADRKMLESAYRYGIGARTANIEDITAAFKAESRIINVEEKGRSMCTNKEVLGEEKRMVDLAVQGKGKMIPLYDDMPEIKQTGQQRTAIEHVLTTPNRVSIVRGAAGTGKTTILHEATKHIEAAGKQITLVAPTVQASRVVLKEEEGFEQANTVATLLKNKEMQKALKGQVLWVDEAGLLGTKDMLSLLEIATEQNAQLILGGDTRQHASVARGDALRVLNQYAKIPAAEVTKIYRQESEEYRSAVKDLAEGFVADGFAKLDKLGFIKSVDPSDTSTALVEGYFETIKSGKTALVVCPTHAQGNDITQQIRNRMKQEGLLGSKEVDVVRLRDLRLTEAEKGDIRNYQDGQVIRFNQNVKGFPRGSTWTVDITDDEVSVINEKGEAKPLPIKSCGQYAVYEKTNIGLSLHDKVVITAGCTDKDGKRLDNGSMLEVSKVTVAGEIELINKVSQNKYRIDKDFGCMNHAHCITSHASQGKTVDEVFIYQPSATFVATNAKQFYVSISRGRQKAHLYTDDKVELLQQVQGLGDRKSAIELTRSKSLSYAFERSQNIEPPKQRKDYEPDR